jgi:predicted dehydrogenase
MYDVAVVGCGVIGERLADAFAAHPDTRVHAVCDVRAERADAFADDYGARAYTDHRDAVADDAVDAVHVGVPPVHHADVVANALDAGVHVVCEKPIAESADVGARMSRLAADSDRVTAVNLPFRYRPGALALRDAVADGDLGEVQRVRLDFRFPRWPREWQDVDWLRGREQGGPLREVGTHFLFAIQEFHGPTRRVCVDVGYAGPGECEDDAAGYFVTGEGARGTLDLTCGGAGVEENAVTVEGTEGALSLRGWNRLVADPGTPEERLVTDDRGETTLTLVDEFVTAMDGGDADLVSFAEATRVQRTLDAVFASEGAPVDSTYEV